ncbi:uncharacterized protein F5147DRAFT_785028 [Suillus discolor]|uniref:Uncharacterized protein n=1 Tax=Suillus discolor TaxID=1912936 RepID=A0A9P7JKP9_9AGAM|nr:uncharacterized protein F5147DRAFT_785028 [Suillus discolor]KAG2079480.1 hypothetical protein F5147DRAFT_785028 [Suillus discolor]
MNSNTSKILKPEGEAGRPGHGGYNLEDTLHWDALRFKQFKESVHRSINKHCDTRKSKMHQLPTALISVQNDMSCLMTFVSSHPDDDDPDPSVESYSLHELRPVHTYPPQPITTSVHAYPPKPAALPNEDFVMSLYNPWETVRRPRDDDIDRPTKVLFKEVDQSARLRDNVRELQYSKHELLLRKRYAQRNANLRESEMQSVIDQYRQKLESLELEKVEAITSLEQQHHNKIVTLQNRMTLGIDEVQNTAHVERDHVLAEKEAYNFKNASLDSQIRQAQVAVSVSPPAWRHLTGKKPIATCTNIIGYSPILDEDSDSPVDEEPQIAGSGDAGRPLTSLLADVPIENATVGMLVEALAKSLQRQQITFHPGPRSRRKKADCPVEYFTDVQHQDNKVNVRELFKAMFHLTKDEDYMLIVGHRGKPSHLS